ncbi:cytochrome b5-like heme/steroid binding domain-containing protein [Obelidium mucronatum]|nr:cytochrome b5-like heme/steroid binding domain-containing protein [Obelidium mucronatum]
MSHAAFRLFTLQELSEFNGTDPSKPIYLALKNVVYDVSAKPQLYGPGGECHVFAGKDASVAYGFSAKGNKSKLKSSDFNADYSKAKLSEEEKEALENWVSYYEAAYQIVGRVERK